MCDGVRWMSQACDVGRELKNSSATLSLRREACGRLRTLTATYPTPLIRSTGVSNLLQSPKPQRLTARSVPDLDLIRTIESPSQPAKPETRGGKNKAPLVRRGKNTNFLFDLNADAALRLDLPRDFQLIVDALHSFGSPGDPLGFGFLVLSIDSAPQGHRVVDHVHVYLSLGRCRVAD
jgi:hypothetical protein